MRNIYSAFAKKLFGVKYERVSKTLVVCFLVFWGLHIADIQIEIAPFILYLITATFSYVGALERLQRLFYCVMK